MKKYIVSLVFNRLVKPQKQMILKASEAGVPAWPDIELQNFVAITDAESAEDAYNKCSPIARAKFPGMQCSVRLVIEAEAADLTTEQ